MISLYVEARRGDVRRKELKASTLAAYEAKLGLVEQVLGPLPVDAVEPEDVERAFSRWTEKNGPNAALGAPQGLLRDPGDPLLGLVGVRSHEEHTQGRRGEVDPRVIGFTP